MKIKIPPGYVIHRENLSTIGMLSVWTFLYSYTTKQKSLTSYIGPFKILNSLIFWSLFSAWSLNFNVTCSQKKFPNVPSSLCIGKE